MEKLTMPKVNSIEKLPADVKHWLVRSIIEKSYGNYDKLLATLTGQGYTISRSSLARFGKKLTDQFEIIRLIGPNSPVEEKSRIEQIRLRCLELAKGDKPDVRIAMAEQYLSWILNR